ncbi:spermatogenesis-associated protein 7 [Colossoma macropomum]|uniref:spermatogenesis-associated protein 7 n=1 Tax=Colossoma macropomum TaxID=42526 RepID=UPI001864A57C|nr:spermatogenesis-associated protein 7 [Colossoma macropomum]
MGYLAEFPIMDAKRAFCHGSTGNLTNQHIIQDHMISHYKKIYSAKAAVDCSVPKSMCRSIKYIDQKRREQMKKDMSERSQSVRSLSQRSLRMNTVTPCSSKNTRPTVRGEESAHFDLGGSTMSSPRFNTSFHCKQVVYASQMTASSQNCRTTSEFSYRSPNSRWHHLTPSCTTSASQKKFKSFQDPTQKTYSGDVLLKHAHCFTQEKPFTPRTLKSDCKPTLSTYRYYTPASRKGTDEKTSSKFHRQDTYHGSTHIKQGSSAEQDSPQPYNLEHEWSDEETNEFGHYSTANKFRDGDILFSSSRVSPEGMRSPIMRKVTAEEEELMYLEFITDVTNEIIARGIYSDRVLERVFERHIDMNRHRLDEVKMRHLLDVLQNDLQSPAAAPVMAIEKRDRDSSMLSRHKYSSMEQDLTLTNTDDSCLLPYTPFDKDTEELCVTPSLHSTPVNCSVSDRAGLITQGDSVDLELDHQENNAVSPTPSLGSQRMNKVEKHQNCTENDELMQQLDELGRNMAESLRVSETHGSQEGIEQDSKVKLSDDEF